MGLIRRGEVGGSAYQGGGREVVGLDVYSWIFCFSSSSASNFGEGCRKVKLYRRIICEFTQLSNVKSEVVRDLSKE